MARCKIDPRYRKADERNAHNARDKELLSWISSQITRNKKIPQRASQRNYNMLCRREARRRGLM